MLSSKWFGQIRSCKVLRKTRFLLLPSHLIIGADIHARGKSPLRSTLSLDPAGSSKPDLSSSKGREAFLFQGYLLNCILRKDITHGGFPLYIHLAEIKFKEKLLKPCFGFYGVP